MTQDARRVGAYVPTTTGKREQASSASGTTESGEREHPGAARYRLHIARGILRLSRTRPVLPASENQRNRELQRERSFVVLLNGG
jgi:hypothetical protein